jgi:predicted Zn finger-like uncharacterized protein
MPIIVQCPACGRKLRVPDDLLGKQVKCPGCGGTFTGQDKTAAPKAEPKPPAESTGIPALDNLHLDLEEEPAPPPPPPPSRAPVPPPAPPPRKEEIVRQESAPEPVRSKPASKSRPKPRDEEDEDDDDGKEPCPYCGKRIRSNSIRCKYCGEELDETDDDQYEEERPSRCGRSSGRGVRRDSLPHRGGMIAAMGITSLCLIAFDVFGVCCCGGLSAIINTVISAVGLGLGIPAWIMGQRDLAKMRQGLMDERGRGSTQSGWICGMIGTILHGLAIVGSIALFIILIAYFGFAAATSRSGGIGGGPGPNPFGPQPPGPNRKFFLEPGTLRLWQYLPNRDMTMNPAMGR